MGIPQPHTWSSPPRTGDARGSKPAPPLPLTGRDPPWWWVWGGMHAAVPSSAPGMCCCFPVCFLALRASFRPAGGLGWAGARQLGVCILQAVPGCCPGLGAAPARARWKVGFQTDLSLLRSQGSQKQCPRWSEEEKGRRQPQPPACPREFSFAAGAPCPRADCDLLWWDEPYNNKITSLPQGTGHRVHPHPLLGVFPLLAADGAHRDAGQVFSHSTVLPFHHPLASLAWSERKDLDYPVAYFFIFLFCFSFGQ